MADLPLEGLNVLELGGFWSVPICTSYLGYMGAEVIKVESIQSPDRMRFGLPWDGPWWETCYYYLGTNTGKIDVTLNLNDPKGKELFKKLVARSDVVIENYSVRVMENFGLTYDVLKEVNPKIIMVRSPGFGTTGPWRDVPTFALALELFSGMAGLTGYPGEQPFFIMAAADPMGGQHLMFIVLAALEYRRRTGKGQLIDISQMEICASYLGQAFMDYSMNQREWGRRTGNRDTVMVPHNVYKCQEKKTSGDKFGEDHALVAIAIASDDEWKAFCQAIGNPKWATDERFSTALGRRKHEDELDKLIEQWTLQHDNYEVMHLLQKAGVAAGAVVEPWDTPIEPQFVAREFYQELEHPIIGKQIFNKYPVKTSKTATKLSAPRTLGQDNQYVLGTILGLPETEIAQLKKDKIIGTVPVAFAKDKD
jgi:crotonobetainyl-CoA:carnitine CoA-transferase CaiB-like acyl-CoA transferase